jgi:hypothetical protein
LNFFRSFFPRDDPKASSSEVDTGSREENASKQKMRAFSSEVDTGSCEENASKQKIGAFSSEVDTGSREENASKQKIRASVLIQSEPRLSPSGQRPPAPKTCKPLKNYTKARETQM